MKKKKWKKHILTMLCCILCLFALIPDIPAKATVSNGQIIDITADDAIAWLNSNIGKSLGTVVNGHYQCVGLTNQYMKYLGTSGYGGNAYTYANSNNAPSGITVIQGAIPQKGDILVYTENSKASCHGYGHVSVYETDTCSFHQNYSGKNYVSREQNVKYNYSYRYTCDKCGTLVTQSYWGVWRPNFTTDHIPVGYVDDVITTANTVTVTGWAYDPDRSSQSLDIHVYIGESDQNRELGKVGTANLSSQDVNNQCGITGNHRFSITFETNRVGTQKIWVYPINIDKNGNAVERHAHIEDGKGVASVNITGKVSLVGISLNKTSVTLNKGATDNLTVSYNPTNTTDSKTVTWSSGNTSVAKVDQNGKITAVNKGTTTITAKVGSKTASCNVTVKVPLTGISLNKTTLALNRGVTETLTVNYNPSDTTDSKTVTWSSGNTSVAKVDQNGKITAVNKGTTTITAKVGSKTASCNVTVKVPLTGISLNKTTLALNRGVTETLTVNYNPSDTTDSKTVTWSSENTSVAKVDQNGKITAVDVGTTNILAKVGNKTASCSVTVKAPLTGISLNKTTLSLRKQSTETLVVSYDPINTTDDKTITWTSDNEEVATVSGGTVSALKEGTATITATVGSCTAQCVVTVEKENTEPVKKPLTAISLGKATMNLKQGSTDTLTVTYTPEDTTDDKTVTWTSDNEEVATVSGGTVSALKEGTATITATVGSCTAQCVVTVEKENTEPVKKPLTAISLDKATMNLKQGSTDMLTVTYTPGDTTDDKTVTWTSDNEEVATVSGGTVSALKEGTATITATVGSCTAQCVVTVEKEATEPVPTKKPLTAISLDKTTMNLKQGSTDTLTVTYTPGDTTDDKTVTWTSDNEEVATVSGGTVSALKEGTATITATVGSCTAQCVVTVEKEATEPVKKPLTAISLDKATMNLKQGSTDTLTVTYTPGDTTDDKTVTWTSDNEEVATVSGGTISALKEGTATITATVGSCTAQCVVTVEKEATEPVKKPLTAISLDKATMNLKQGGTDTLTVTYTPGDTTDDKTVTWTSDNEEVATVSGGTVSALKEGTATITATVGSCTAQCVVTVVPKQEQPNLPSEPNNYSITEGANGTHKINEDGTYVLRASGELDKFVSIEVDGMLLDSSNYTLKRGSTIVTFTKEYMDQLAVGTHVVKINFTDGVATTSINIQQNTANKNDKKNTGDVTIVNNQAADSANNQVTNTETLTDTKTDEIIVDNSIEVQSPKTGDDNQCMWIFAICLACSFGFILRFKKFKK